MTTTEPTTTSDNRVDISFGILERPAAGGKTMYAPFIQLATAKGTTFTFDCNMGFGDREDCAAAVHTIADIMENLNEAKVVK